MLCIYRGFAKKTLLKTARKAGFKQKVSSKRQKYVLPNLGLGNTFNGSKYLTSPVRNPQANSEDFHDDDLSSKYF